MSSREAISGDQTTTRIKHPYIVLTLILAFVALLRLAIFSGYSGEDDFFYMAMAVELAEGREPSDVGGYWKGRTGMTAPLAALFALFGPSLTTLTALPFTWSMLSVVFAFLIAKQVYDDERVALLGAFLVGIFPMNVIMATLHLPAMGLGAFTAAAFLLFLVGVRRGHGLCFLLAGVAFGIAYTHRITAIFMVLPAGLWLLYDRRWRAGYVWSLVGLLMVVGLEMAWFTAQAGDPLYRFRAIVRPEASVQLFSHATKLSNPMTWLTRPAISLLFNQEYALFYYLMIPATVWLAWRRDKQSSPLILWFTTVAAYTLWGTTSLSDWMPLYPLPRYMSVVTVPGVLLLARWLVRSPKRWRQIAIILLTAASMACLYLDKHRDYRSLGDGLLEFGHRHPESQMYVTGNKYAAMYVANGLRPPERVSFLGMGTWGWTRTLNPTLEMVADKFALQDCFVALPTYYRNPIPESWVELERITIPDRWYLAPLRKQGGILEEVAGRLRWPFSITIYRVPPTP